MSALFANVPFVIVLTGILVGVAASVVGTFLVLRGSAMLADAISHSIVFGIVAVWLLSGLTTGPLQIAGAAAAGLLTVALTETLGRTRLVREDAAIGLVFPALFAAGILLINVYGRDVHLDEHAVLLGEIGFVWLDTTTVLDIPVPRALVAVGALALVNTLFVSLFFKELKLATFDPALATALGFAPGTLFSVLLALTSATAVASFDAVGAVLFIAFVVVPPAAAILLTDRLGIVLLLAPAIAAASAVGGYWLAIRWNVSIGACMALMTGLFFASAFLFGPRYGLLAQHWLRGRQGLELDCRSLAAHLGNHEDTLGVSEGTTTQALSKSLRWDPVRTRRVILRAMDRGTIIRDGRFLKLTNKGRAEADTVLKPDRRDDSPR